MAGTEGVTTPPRVGLRRAALAASIGTMLEYYDYYLFGLAASVVFPKLFFPADNHLLSLLASFATFAVGFVLRPIGGLVIGHFGDRVGRKPALILTVILMGTSTFLIGVLPTYQGVGVAAPVLLVLLRLVQGFSVGGEMGGATSLAVEYAPRHRRGLFGALLISGAGVALLSSSGLMAAVSALPSGSFLSWGWRIPFLLSAVLLVAGLIMRAKVSETPVFENKRAEVRRERAPIKQVLRTPKLAILAIVFNLAAGIGGYVIITYGPAYLEGRGIPPTVGYVGLLVTGAFEVVLAPLWGLLSDRFGRRPVYIAGCAGLFVFIYPVFLLFDTGNTGLILLAMVIGYSVFAVILSALSQTIMSELFDTGARYTGVSVGYQFGGVITGTAPFVATALAGATNGHPWSIAAYVMLVAVISSVAVYLLPEGSHRDFTADAEAAVAAH